MRQFRSGSGIRTAEEEEQQQYCDLFFLSLLDMFISCAIKRWMCVDLMGGKPIFSYHSYDCGDVRL